LQFWLQNYTFSVEAIKNRNERARRVTGYDDFLNFVLGQGCSFPPIRWFEIAVLLKTDATLIVPSNKLNPLDWFVSSFRIAANEGDHSLSDERLPSLNTNKLKHGAPDTHVVNGAA
jgi:hypothetical protein